LWSSKLTRPEQPKVDAEGRGGGEILGEGLASPSPPAREGMGSTVSCPSGAWGSAPEAKRFCSILTAIHVLWWYLNMVAT